MLEAPLDAREVLEDRIGDAFSEAPNCGRAEAVHVSGIRTPTAQAAERLEDDGGLPDPSRTGHEHVLAVFEPLHETTQVALAPYQIGRGHGSADREVGDHARRTVSPANHRPMIHLM